MPTVPVYRRMAAGECGTRITSADKKDKNDHEYLAIYIPALWCAMAAPGRLAGRRAASQICTLNTNHVSLWLKNLTTFISRTHTKHTTQNTHQNIYTEINSLILAQLLARFFLNMVVSIND